MVSGRCGANGRCVPKSATLGSTLATESAITLLPGLVVKTARAIRGNPDHVTFSNVQVRKAIVHLFCFCFNRCLCFSLELKPIPFLRVLLFMDVIDQNEIEVLK